MYDSYQLLRARSVTKRALVVVALVPLFGCVTSPSDAPPGIRFVVQASEYARTDTISAVVSNDSWVALTHGSTPCNVGIERRVEGGWGQAQALYFAPGGSVACDAAGYGILPGGERWVGQPVREWMEPGQYRLTFHIYWPRTDGRNYTLVSNTFTILPE